MNKYRFFVVLLFAGFWLAGCESFFFQSAYSPKLPPLPDAWVEVLTAPRWRIEWIGGDGERKVLDTGAEEAMSLEFPLEYPSPVLAFPYWPERNLPPGLMRPAGAIYPFDLEGGQIVLSWRGGVDAWVWRELDATEDSAFPLRRPELFDWPRFRRLLEDKALAEEVRKDPWIVDWENFCRKTVQSGFDRRRIKAESRKELVISGFEGHWAGSSPFADPILGNPLHLKLGESPESFISTGGILRCTRSTWIWLPW